MTKTARLAAAFLLMLAPVAQASEADREQAAANFMQADADGDGALTLSEFTTMIDLNAASGIGRAATIKRFGRYGIAFSRIDADADGLATVEELQAMRERANR